MRAIATIIIVLLSFCSITCSTSGTIEQLQAVSRSTTSLRKKLFCKDMQDRIRYMHEILSQIARLSADTRASASVG
jgi:hypothetical protein